MYLVVNCFPTLGDAIQTSKFIHTGQKGREIIKPVTKANISHFVYRVLTPRKFRSHSPEIYDYASEAQWKGNNQTICLICFLIQLLLWNVLEFKKLSAACLPANMTQIKSFLWAFNERLILIILTYYAKKTWVSQFINIISGVAK